MGGIGYSPDRSRSRELCEQGRKRFPLLGLCTQIKSLVISPAEALPYLEKGSAASLRQESQVITRRV